jgi:hypothetical protein
MSGIKMLITDFTTAVTRYQTCDPARTGRRAEYATRAASVALAIALRSTEHHALWCEISADWAQRAHPQRAALA